MIKVTNGSSDPQRILFSKASMRGRPRSPGSLAVSVAEIHGVSLEFYEPKGVDAQKPHSEDEMYFVASGTASLNCGSARYAVGAGDSLFVARDVAHNFEDMTDDFTVWVLFVPSVARRLRSVM